MAAPFDTVSAAGRAVPLYLLQSDKSGNLTSPEARDDLLARIADGSLRDVYLFAHGWNNDFGESLDLFKRFFSGFLERRPASATTDWKPVFVGLQWPSIVLVFPWEKGPKIAGANPVVPAKATPALTNSERRKCLCRKAFRAFGRIEFSCSAC